MLFTDCYRNSLHCSKRPPFARTHASADAFSTRWQQRQQHSLLQTAPNVNQSLLEFVDIGLLWICISYTRCCMILQILQSTGFTVPIRTVGEHIALEKWNQLFHTAEVCSIIHHFIQNTRIYSCRSLLLAFIVCRSSVFQAKAHRRTQNAKPMKRKAQLRHN